MLAINRLCSLLNCNSLFPFSLYISSPCLPRTSSQISLIPHSGIQISHHNQEVDSCHSLHCILQLGIELIFDTLASILRRCIHLYHSHPYTLCLQSNPHNSLIPTLPILQRTTKFLATPTFALPSCTPENTHDTSPICFILFPLTFVLLTPKTSSQYFFFSVTSYSLPFIDLTFQHPNL